MASTPQEIKEGPIIAIARMDAKPGKADETAQFAANLKARADSDLEPGTLQYNIVRYGNSFQVFEVYKDHEAIAEHFKGNPLFEEFSKVRDDLIEPVTPTFWSAALPEPTFKPGV